jgi:hypothetical protein
MIRIMSMIPSWSGEQKSRRGFYIARLSRGLAAESPSISRHKQRTAPPLRLKT